MDSETQMFTVEIDNRTFSVIEPTEMKARQTAAERFLKNVDGLRQLKEDIATETAEIRSVETVPELPEATDELLSEADVLLLDHEDLHDFVASSQIDGFDTIGSEVSVVLTEDEFTRGKLKFNLIDSHPAMKGRDYGIVTQLNDPFRADETVVDLRRRHSNEFNNWVMGLQPSD